MYLSLIAGIVAMVLFIISLKTCETRWCCACIITMVIVMIAFFPVLGLEDDWEVGETKELLPIEEKIYLIEDGDIYYYSYENEEGKPMYNNLEISSLEECKVIETGETPKIIKMHKRAIGEPWIGGAFRPVYWKANKVIFMVPPDAEKRY